MALNKIYLSLFRTFSNRSKDSQLIIEGTKKLPPRTPGMRHARIADTSHLWKGSPIEYLTAPLRKTGGRNCDGRITVRGRGGGHKRRYRIIDFKRDAFNDTGVVVRLEYDPNRSSDIALIKYSDEKLTYIIAPEGLKPGDTIVSSRDKEIPLIIGNAMPLKNIPIGQMVHNVELRPGKGGQLARSAGCSLKIFEKDTGRKGMFVSVEMKSKEKRLINKECLATIGRVGNVNHNRLVLGKAGRNRWLGRRPKVRGVAMNPCDHPHGGGNGRSKGKNSVSKWGKPTKGYRTRKKGHRTDRFRLERRPRNKKRYKTDEKIQSESKWKKLTSDKDGVRLKEKNKTKK